MKFLDVIKMKYDLSLGLEDNCCLKLFLKKLIHINNNTSHRINELNPNNVIIPFNYDTSFQLKRPPSFS